MVCPECRRDYSIEANTVCPHCGFQLTSGVVKSSTILIATGAGHSVYRSVSDVPAGLRGKLIRSTNSLNATTIVIADERGRRELARALKRLPGAEAPADGHADVVYGRALRVIGSAIVLGTAALAWLLLR